ncbi:MAG: hypothetical protein E7594_07855 [Ruminococcaceae bacterium]|nr:hypothetical protein [Oscillospiraceae bacterium]
MKEIGQIDRNFEVKTNIGKSDLHFHSALCEPFKIYGVFYENGKFRRIPEQVAKSVSEGVYVLHTHTAGGRVRFRTNSPYVAIHAKMSGVGKMPHFALCGSAGFDMYIGDRYVATFMPPFDIVDGYEGIVDFGCSMMRDITIHFPLYSNVEELYIGLADGASIENPAPYAIQKPIVYYGSSITQGGCASRPGTSYQSFVSREIDADYLNLGFSGNARAEKEMVEYIKSLSMSVFVLDYDHNAPSVEHLKNTHERMFLEIREQHPDLPVVMMSRPKLYLSEEELERLEIIKATYENALARGDKNVYFIDGRELMAWAGNEGTVDTCHPTDLGFSSMAKALIPVLGGIL